MSEALAALLANHKHHQDYDDYGGYKGSELEQQNLEAIAKLQSPQPAPLAASAEDMAVYDGIAKRYFSDTKPAPLAGEVTDEQIERVARSHGTGGWQTLPDMIRFARAILALRPQASAPAAEQAEPVAPEMSSIALRKLGGLQDRGWQINGYAIRRGNERGFVDASGFVGWWRSEIAPVAPDDVARYQAIRNGLVYIEPHESGEIYVAGESGVYTKSGAEFDSAIDAIAASQQKGGSAG